MRVCLILNILLLCFNLTLYGTSNGFIENIIESIDVKKTSIRVIPNNYFKKRFLKDDFFIEYMEQDINLKKLDFSIISLPFILNIISAIWISGEQYYIYSMDIVLFESLKRIKEIFKILYPNTQWNGELIPIMLVKNDNKLSTKNNNKIALLFSHGVDSVFSSLKHRDKEQILVTAWGHYDTPLDKEEMWGELRLQIQTYAKQFGYKHICIRSNYHGFIKFKELEKLSNEINCWRIEAIEGLGWAGMLAPVLRAKGISKLLIGSTYTWDCLFPTIAIEPIDNNIKIADLEIKHFDLNVFRTEKTAYIVNFYKNKLNKPKLFVCQNIKLNEKKNCCKCNKCIRTLIDFMLNGEEFSQFGFQISKLVAIERIKKYFLSNLKLSNAQIWFFQEQQKIAKESLYQFEPMVCKLFEWFITIDFLKMYKMENVNLIDWKNLAHLYPNIPQKYLVNKRELGV